MKYSQVILLFLAGSKAIKLSDNKEDYNEASFNEDTLNSAAI